MNLILKSIHLNELILTTHLGSHLSRTKLCIHQLWFGLFMFTVVTSDQYSVVVRLTKHPQDTKNYVFVKQIVRYHNFTCIIIV